MLVNWSSNAQKPYLRIALLLVVLVILLMVVPSIILVGRTVGQLVIQLFIRASYCCVALWIVSSVVLFYLSVEWPLSDTIVRPLLYVGR